MWNGPGPGLGPRGGPPFRGDHRGGMFGRDRPMPDFRGRDGMNMGPMGPMGPRPHDLPPMDMRRMDGPPMRGRDMDPRDMRNREPKRDFFRPGDEPDFIHRRQYETNVGDKRMNSGSFPGPGRNMADMGGRGGQPREPNSRYMDNRERDSLHFNMPQFHNDPGMDGRRFGFPLDGGDRKDFRNMHDRPPMGMGEPDHYNMDMPPRENRMMDFERRGGPPFNPRGAFDSDTDFRSRHGPSPEFSRRDRSPLRFGNRDAPMDRARSDATSNVAGPQKSEYISANNPLRERDFEDSADSPLSDYRGGEEMSLAEEWKNRQKEKKAFLNIDKNMGGPAEPNFSMGFRRDINVRDGSFPKGDKPSLEFPAKEVGLPHADHFPPINLPPVCVEGPSLGPLDQEKEKNRWLGEGNLQHGQNSLNLDERAPYHKEKNQSLLETPTSADFVNDPHSHGPARVKMGPHSDFENTTQVKDQDYRDIDYRTGTGRTFDYHHEVLQAPQKLIKDSKPIAHTRFSDSGPQDQDYRSALGEDKASNTISIIGIPKTATMEQILGAFADPSGVPMQGMKINNVVPGYSYDTAYVEFLNLEDAVHFMESNKGSLKVGTRTTSMRYIQAEDCGRNFHEADQKVPLLPEPLLPPPDKQEPETISDSSEEKGSMEPLSQSQWQRSSDLTPEAWQQQVDQQLKEQLSEQQEEPWAGHSHHHHSWHKPEAIFKDSKTMILKNVKATTSVEAILKALDPFAYLDERNVRLVKAKPPGAKCFCFVDMDSHEQVTRLVELLTKPKPLFIDGVRVYAEVAKPLKNPNFRRDGDGPNSSMMTYPPDPAMMGPQHYPPHPHFFPPPTGVPAGLQDGSHPVVPPNPGMDQGVGYGEAPALDPSTHPGVTHVPIQDPAGMSADASQSYVYGSEIPDMSTYLYDATSGFYYDPETTLYYDPSSRYFYNSQIQEYLYWDATSKTYIPVPAGTAIEGQPAAMTAEDQAILSNPAADAPLELKKPSAPPQATELPTSALVAGSTPEAVYTSTAAPEKKDEDDPSKKDKEEKPKSIAAVKIMKDMERWAKIQNRQKDSVRAASPVLKSGLDDERKQSKSADAGFAIFERKISGADDLFKKPLAPPKKDEKSKRPMGSLGMLASDYAAGSDEEVEEEREEPTKNTKESPSDKDSKLTDWKKMACLLCRRQFPNKDALIRHQQLSDLHKQNMEIHLKIKRSKKELEALENQEKELSARENPKSPEQKRRKQHHQQPAPHNSWAGSSRETHKFSERPGLGAEPVQPRKKKEHVVWTHATYKEAVRKAMFARFKELE